MNVINLWHGINAIYKWFLNVVWDYHQQNNGNHDRHDIILQIDTPTNAAESSFNIWYWTQTQGVFVCPFSAITNRKYDILSNKNVSHLNFPYCLLLLFSQIFRWNMIFFDKIWQSVANETVISLEGGNIVDILFSDKL